MLAIHQEKPGGNRRGITLEEFARSFLTICDAHRSQGRAWAFAFIFVDHSTQQLREVLSNDFMWEALDELSGRDLTVFSFHCAPPRLRRPTRQAFPADSIGRFVSIGLSEVPEERLVWKYFDGCEVRPPSVLLFQVEGTQIIDSIAFALKASDAPKVYAVLQEAISAWGRHLRKITPANGLSAEDIFNSGAWV